MRMGSNDKSAVGTIVTAAPTTETAIVLMEPMTALQLFAPGKSQEILDSVRNKVMAIDRDISTETGRTRVASVAHQIARTKTGIDALRIELVEPEKKRLALIDVEGKKLRDGFDALKKEFRKPLTDWEQAEETRLASHEEALAELAAVGTDAKNRWMELPAEALAGWLEGTLTQQREWQEFGLRAEQVKALTVQQLREAITKREAYDSGQRELARLRAEAAERERIAHEQAIAEAARIAEVERAAVRAAEVEKQAQAERQRVQREAAEREAAITAEKAAAEARARKAEEDRIASEEKATREAAETAARVERERIAAEQRAEAEKAAAIKAERDRQEREREAEAEAERAREADKTHRGKINSAAVAAFKAAGIVEETAKTVVKLIAQGVIPAVKISY